MKKIIVSIVALLMFLGLVACNSNVGQDPRPKPTEDIEVTPTFTPTPTPLQDPDPSWGLFDNVSNITVYDGTGNGYIGSYLTFNSKEAIERFIDDIRIIEEVNEIVLEGDADNIHYPPYYVGYPGTLEDEELLGLNYVTIAIEYDDTRTSSKVQEFIDDYYNIFDDGDGMRIVYDNQVTFYENRDNIIARKLVDMIKKDDLAYVQVYREGEYSRTQFLQPHIVKTEDYTITGSYYYGAFYYDYWADYISSRDFTVYKQYYMYGPTFQEEDIVDGLPIPDGEKEVNVFLVDEKGNVYQYAYDRKERDAPLCTVDEENTHRYYCE